MMKTIDIYKAAIADLESFYSTSYDFKVKVEFYHENGIHPASIIGSNENSFLRFTTDACEKEINNNTDFLFGLLIVCHELAHYVNKHNYYTTPNHEAHRLIEAWADMFGMKIMLLLFMKGNEVNKLLSERNFPSGINYFLNEIGETFSFTATYLFNNSSPKYHRRIERIMHCAAGVNSFLDSHFEKRSMERSINVYSRIYSAAGLTLLIKSDFDTNNLTTDDFDFLHTIHVEIQNGQCAITQGLKKEFRKYIDTNFPNSNFVVTSNKKKILSGLLLHEVSNNNNFDNLLFLMEEYLQSSLKQDRNKAKLMKDLFGPPKKC